MTREHADGMELSAVSPGLPLSRARGTPRGAGGGAFPAATVLRLPAYAKVNLALEIVGRRSDGFHELVSVTQMISLHDTLEATESDRLRVETEPAVVSQAENLVTRAAQVLAAAVGRQPTGHLAVRKRTPLAAGLGGGSSDAAAALRLLDRLWRTRLGSARLAEIAARLGSDVPLFLTGGTALVSGRGEIVEALPPPPTFWLALACPPCDVPEKTRALYGALQPGEWSDGATTRRLADRIQAGHAVVDAALVNAFDGPAARVYPDFAALRSRLADAAGAPIHLTGAGPSLFALFTSRAAAGQAARRMARLGVPTLVARSVPGRPRPRPLPVATERGAGPAGSPSPLRRRGGRGWGTPGQGAC